MTIKIKGNLILKADTIYNESIEVEGHIICESERFSLKVAGNIDAWNINAWNINAWNIDAWNINAGNINAWDINAWNINAGNIDARNIDAGDIFYYAVCFAYQNIKCKSIKGNREKHKHFCLDGKITKEMQYKKTVKMLLNGKF